MNKAAQIIKNLSQGFLISGILSALMGAYYLFAKAGLPSARSSAGAQNSIRD